MKKYMFLILFFAFIDSALSNEFPEWEGYAPMFKILDVAEFKGEIYGVTSNGLLRYNPVNNEYKLYYKNHGLSAVNVSCIGTTSREIFIGFKTAGLMIFDPEKEIFTPVLFPEYVSDDILKTISLNDIFALNDSILFIGHSKGIDMLNLTTEEIRTYSKLSSGIQENTPVNQVKVLNGKIFACTEAGLAWADLNNPNLEFSENWVSAVFPSGVSSVIDYKNDLENRIFVGTSDNGVFLFDCKTKSKFPIIDSKKIFNLNFAFNNYFAAAENGLYICSKESVNSWHLVNGTVAPFSLAGDSLKLWVGTLDEGLKCYTDSGFVDIKKLNGPVCSTFRKIDIDSNGVLWAATSYRDAASGLLRFDNNEWSGYYKTDNLPSETTDSVFIDKSNVLWGATWSAGVYTLNDNATQDKNDDIVTKADPERKFILPYNSNNPDFVVTPDIEGDKNGNIWITAWDLGAYVIEGKLPVTDYKKYHFNIGSTSNFIWKVFPDNDNWVWFVTFESGLIGINTGNDVFDPSDDIIKQLTVDDGLDGNDIQAVHPDNDGNVWVGSERGLNLIEKLSGYNFKIDNMNDILGIDSIEILSIEIDSDKNKWIGTSSGLYKISPGNKLSALYTLNNSGLLSNTILSLKYDEKNKLLWVGTDEGLNSLNLSSGVNNKESKIHFYPNPFEIWGFFEKAHKAHFFGLDSVKKLKIFNFNGDLICELEINEKDSGGNPGIVWDGKNFKGEYISTGVYFISGYDKNGKNFKEKLVVVRR